MNKEQIINNAHRLFLQYGVKSVTMSDIASKLALSKKTLYTYFDTKDSLLGACLETAFSELEERIGILKTKTNDPDVTVLRILLAVLAFLSEYKSPYLYDIRKIPAVKGKQDQYRQHLWNEHILPLLKEARHKQYLVDSVDLMLLCSVYQSILEKFIAQNAQLHARWDILDQYRLILTFSLKGFLAESRTNDWIESAELPS